jgi:hypothetical protein
MFEKEKRKKQNMNLRVFDNYELVTCHDSHRNDVISISIILE